MRFFDMKIRGCQWVMSCQWVRNCACAKYQFAQANALVSSPSCHSQRHISFQANANIWEFLRFRKGCIWSSTSKTAWARSSVMWTQAFDMQILNMEINTAEKRFAQNCKINGFKFIVIVRWFIPFSDESSLQVSYCIDISSGFPLWIEKKKYFGNPKWYKYRLWQRREGERNIEWESAVALSSCCIFALFLSLSLCLCLSWCIW